MDFGGGLKNSKTKMSSLFGSVAAAPRAASVAAAPLTHHRAPVASGGDEDEGTGGALKYVAPKDPTRQKAAPPAVLNSSVGRWFRGNM